MRRGARVGLVGLLAATALLSGCSAGPTGGPNAEHARDSLEELGQRVVAEVGGEVENAETGTVSCEGEDGGDGIDWTSVVEFEAPDYHDRVGAAEQLLVAEGYEVSHGTSASKFHAAGPNGETVVLTPGELTLFTGCVVG